MEKFNRISRFSKFVVLFHCISVSIYAQNPKNQQDHYQQKLKETEEKISSINYTDIQNTMTELNQIRVKLDEHLEQLSRNCQLLTDKNTSNECALTTRANLKKLWSSYFTAKAKYLDFLHQHFLQENSKQAKMTLDFVDSIQTKKIRR